MNIIAKAIISQLTEDQMMKVKEIVNPVNGKQVNVNSKIGKRILRNYLSVLRGGVVATKTGSPLEIRSTPCNENKMFMQSIGICFQDAALNAVFSTDIISDIAMKFFFTFYEKEGKLYPSRVNTFDPVAIDKEQSYNHAMYILLNIVAKNIRNNIKLHNELRARGGDADGAGALAATTAAVAAAVVRRADTVAGAPPGLSEAVLERVRRQHTRVKALRSPAKPGEPLDLKYERIFLQLSIASYALSQYLGGAHGGGSSQAHRPVAESFGGIPEFVVEGLLNIKIAGTKLSSYITLELCKIEEVFVDNGYFSVGGNPLSFLICTANHSLNIYLCNGQWFLFDNNYQKQMKGARCVIDFMEPIPDDFIIQEGAVYKVKLDIISQIIREGSDNVYGDAEIISALYVTEEGREYMKGAIEINPDTRDLKFGNFIEGLGDKRDSFVKLMYNKSRIFVAMERLFPHKGFRWVGNGHITKEDSKIALDNSRTDKFPFSHLDPDGSIKADVKRQDDWAADVAEAMMAEDVATAATAKRIHNEKMAATTKEDFCGNPFYCNDDNEAIGADEWPLEDEECAPKGDQVYVSPAGTKGVPGDCSSYCGKPVCADWYVS